MVYSFSITRSFALLLLLLTASSCGEASIGLRFTSLPFGWFPHTQTGKSGGQVQPLQRLA